MSKSKKDNLTSAIKNVHRQKTLGRNLLTRVAHTEKSKKDQKKARRNWNQNVSQGEY